jgi:hypothetical protein
MRKHWYIAAIAAALMICVAGAAYAQERHEHHWDEHHPMFDDHEHVVVNGWWAAHHEHPVIGFRVEDRLPGDWDARLAPGFVLTVDWRHKYMHAVPADLYAQLPPPPPHFHYYVIGGHICLVDQRDWHVADVININL